MSKLKNNPTKVWSTAGLLLAVTLAAALAFFFNQGITSRASDEGVEFSAVNYQDVVTFKAEGANLNSIEVKVYEPSGNQVFAGSANDNSLDWNKKTTTGEKLAKGVYLYSIRVKTVEGETKQSKVGKILVGLGGMTVSDPSGEDGTETDEESPKAHGEGTVQPQVFGGTYDAFPGDVVFDIEGQLSVNHTLPIVSFNDTSPASEWDLWHNGDGFYSSNPEFGLWDDTDGNNAFVITKRPGRYDFNVPNGRLGVGLAKDEAPVSALEVDGTIYASSHVIAGSYLKAVGRIYNNVTGMSTAAGLELYTGSTATIDVDNPGLYARVDLGQKERIDLGWGGEGGGNMEFYSQDFSQFGKAGNLHFVYGGGSNIGELRFIHYNGSSWTKNLVVDSSGTFDFKGNDIINANIVSPSSRSIKTGFNPVDNRKILDKVAQLPIKEWRYKSDSESVRHIGPVAEQFQEAFGLGSTDQGINLVDAHGVSMVSIKALYEENQEQENRIERLEEKVNEQEKRIEKLKRNDKKKEARIKKLEEQVETLTEEVKGS